MILHLNLHVCHFFPIIIRPKSLSHLCNIQWLSQWHWPTTDQSQNRLWLTRRLSPIQRFTEVKLKSLGKKRQKKKQIKIVLRKGKIKKKTKKSIKPKQTLCIGKLRITETQQLETEYMQNLLRLEQQYDSLKEKCVRELTCRSVAVRYVRSVLTINL